MAAHVTATRPYPGLRPFDYSDRAFYFGREDQIFSLFRMLEYSRFIAVVGSSGSGKSSLVRAGLLPMLESESTRAGGRTWRFAAMQPGNAPLARLADAIASLAPPDDDDLMRKASIANAVRSSSFGIAEALDNVPDASSASIMLVIDQFEEIFRYEGPRMRDDATLFVQQLLEATRTKKYDVYVLLTMRSDFIGDCAKFYGLPEAVSGSQFLVPALTRDQRDEIVRMPVEKAGGSIEPQLVERLLVDAGRAEDDLPVLQHALARLWDVASARPGAPVMRVGDYATIGRLEHALSLHADSVMASLPGKELAIEMVFRSLSEIDREGRATRRGRTFAQLVDETADGVQIVRDDVAAVVERFAASDCGFLVLSPPAPLTDATLVDVVHEALLRRWEKISGNDTDDGWLRAEEQDARWLRGLSALAGSRR